MESQPIKKKSPGSITEAMLRFGKKAAKILQFLDSKKLFILLPELKFAKYKGHLLAIKKNISTFALAHQPRI